MRHAEGHRTQRIGWLRAAVLGANDGIVSTASLVLGVAAAGAGAATASGGATSCACAVAAARLAATLHTTCATTARTPRADAITRR